MRKKEIIDMLQGIVMDRGVPRNVKTSIEESLDMLNGTGSDGEKLAYLVSVLDDASSDPNMSSHARTMIWSAVSFLESLSSE